MSHRDETRDPLLAYRAELGPHPRAAAANWQALVRRIDAGEPAPELPDDLEPPQPRPRSNAWALFLAAAAVALLAVRMTSPAPSSAETRPHDAAAAAAPYQHTTDSAPRGVHASDPPAPASPEPEPEPEPVPADISPLEPAPPALPRPASSSMSERTSAQSGLARELAPVRAAAHAVRDGDGALALRHADEYLARHPKGAFVPEARLRRIEALCLLARRADADLEVSAFLADYPDSPLRERVRSACNSSDGSPTVRPLPE